MDDSRCEYPVERLLPPQFTEAVTVLRDAFRDAPALMSILRGVGQKSRDRKLKVMFREVVHAAARRSHVLGITLDGSVAAVAIFHPPGAYPPSASDAAYLPWSNDPEDRSARTFALHPLDQPDRPAPTRVSPFPPRTPRRDSGMSRSGPRVCDVAGDRLHRRRGKHTMFPRDSRPANRQTLSPIRIRSHRRRRHPRHPPLVHGATTRQPGSHPHHRNVGNSNPTLPYSTLPYSTIPPFPSPSSRRLPLARIPFPPSPSSAHATPATTGPPSPDREA